MSSEIDRLQSRVTFLEGNVETLSAAVLDQAKTNECLRAELVAEREAHKRTDETLHLRSQDYYVARDNVTKLLEALEPFAKAAANFDGMKIKNTEEWFAYAGQASADGHSGSITVGDLRRARTVLGETGK
jgi:hypothetical protein